MGRHRAEPEVRRGRQRAAKQPGRVRRSPELLGWGLFLTAATAACLLWAQIPAAVTAGTSALVLAAFMTAWYASRNPALPAARPAVTPGEAQPEQTNAAPAPSGVQEPAHDAPVMPAESLVPAIPLAPGAAREFLTAPLAGASGTQASRWTRTFGPPETGSLPLQPYVPAQRATVQTADSERHDRRQRSHSSL